MPKKKTSTTESVPDAKTETLGRTPDQTVGGIAAEDLEVLEGDIDSRMAALLKDHQRMGVRPK